ncbi:hypothetical protein [Thioclava sp. FTW29]|uniref:Uncharacterized protein n=1 Tax=Thioclava litoralis TaxID=3076557 RepID=A0ABZ1E569_9RHOB|nr:hypothetical protein RPE78_14170 [Thioclava sp. FTW29]
MSRPLALFLTALVILASYGVPYLLLGDIAAWYGCFLFWALAGLAVIGLNVVATAGFAAQEEDTQ